MDHMSTRGQLAEPDQPRGRPARPGEPPPARGEHVALHARRPARGATPSPTSSRSRCAGRPEPTVRAVRGRPWSRCAGGSATQCRCDPAHHDVRRERLADRLLPRPLRPGQELDRDREGASPTTTSVLLVDLPHHGRSPWSDELRLPRGGRPGGRAALARTSRSRWSGTPWAARRRWCSRCGTPSGSSGCASSTSRRSTTAAAASSAATSGHARLDLDALEPLAGDADALARGGARADRARVPAPEPRRDGDGWRWQPNLEVLGRGARRGHGLAGRRASPTRRRTTGRCCGSRAGTPATSPRRSPTRWSGWFPTHPAR